MLEPHTGINTNNFFLKGPVDDLTNIRTDILYYHSGDLNPWPVPHTMHAITGRKNYHQKATQTARQTEIHIISTGTHWGPLESSLGDKCIATLDPHTKNQEKYRNCKKACRQLLTTRGFEPMDCSHMHYAQLWAAQMVTKNQRG